jgi:SAM-dependent methyltransferase
MKNANSLAPEICQRYSHIRQYDLEEIDHPDPRAASRVSYVNRVEQLVRMISRIAPPPATVLDWGCAQGNLSLLLAEQGYRVVALDLRQDFMEYARTKHERGRVDWLVANLEQSCIRPGVADVVLLCEVLEHCAFPETIVQSAATGLRSGGVLVATTPNGRYLANRLPTLTALTECDRKALAKRQYGPAGPDHLFAFTLPELRAISLPTVRPLMSGYLGNILLSHPRVQPLVRRLPVRWIFALMRGGERIPLMNQTFAPGLFCLYAKI